MCGVSLSFCGAASWEFGSFSPGQTGSHQNMSIFAHSHLVSSFGCFWGIDDQPTLPIRKYCCLYQQYYKLFGQLFESAVTSSSTVTTKYWLECMYQCTYQTYVNSEYMSQLFLIDIECKIQSNSLDGHPSVENKLFSYPVFLLSDTCGLKPNGTQEIWTCKFAHSLSFSVTYNVHVLSCYRAVVSGMREVPCKTIDEVLYCLQHGSAARQTGSTQMNEHSSRSHSVFTVTIGESASALI